MLSAPCQCFFSLCTFSSVTPSVSSQSPRYSWTMCSTAEVYWQEKNHHKESRETSRVPPPTTGCSCCSSVCVCVCGHTNGVHSAVLVWWIPTRDSLRRTKGEASMWNKQYSNFNSRPAQWLEALCQEGHKFKNTEYFEQDPEDPPACSLTISNITC